ncbi:MAG: fatty acid desaturase [Trichormus sp. ATA11-4-KO1]|jgi:fatty acid desaturase|nr:fatty acid desaturase [Trichormus sp. ATA11-4-KO1]
MPTTYVQIPETNAKISASEIEVKKTPNLKFYIHHRNYWINGITIAYIFASYGFSLFCITVNIWWLNLLGVALLTHTLTWAALFLHELFHHNIFSRPSLNAAFGEAMLFLTGSCYSRFRDLALHHIAHHVHRADFSPFFPASITDFLKSLPTPILRLIIFLEWLCIPAVNLIFRWMIALAPFLSQNRRDERVQNAVLLMLRGVLFTVLAIYSPRSVILYFIAYSCFLHIIQFIEGFQHTYSAFIINAEVPKYSLDYEEANTYSLVLPPWLSLILCLNNNYHNAHHVLMTCPWYLLPQLDAELYLRDYLQYVSAPKLLNNYFRYRIHRLLQGQGTVERSKKGLNLDNFEGATGMSFMILRQPFDWLKIPS